MDLPSALAVSDRTARLLIEHGHATNTKAVYVAAWRSFSSWCLGRERDPLPAAPEVVADYLVDRGDEGRPGALAINTLQIHANAISTAHRLAGHLSPTRTALVRGVLRALRRQKGSAVRQVAPLTVDALRRLLAALPTGVTGARNRALLLLGFAGAFRRSELVAIAIEDLEETEAGLTVRIRRSKTDQEGEGRKVGIPTGAHPETCPVRAVRAWREVSGVASGPLFRATTRDGCVLDHGLGARSVALTLKRYARRVGLDPTRYAGHSLRSGLATAAAAAGVAEPDIARQTGHRSMAVLRRYIRDGELYRRNAAAAVGL